MDVDFDFIPKRKSDILEQTTEDTVILLAIDSGEYYALDEISGRIWELCDAKTSVQGIVETVASEYDASYDSIKADVLEVIEELRREQLILGRPAA